MKERVGFLMIIVAVLTLVLAVQRCQGALEDAIAASCRVRAPGGIGSGVCVMNRPYVVVLTNAHVVGSSKSATCEFLWGEALSARVSGDVIWKNSSGNADMALVRIDPKVFKGRVPRAIMLAPPGYKYPVGTPLVWIGCAAGIKPTVIRGKISKYSSDVIWLSPKVRSGESGSGVFDANGNYLLGLVYATNSQYGVAQYSDLLHSKLHRTAYPDCDEESGLCDRFGGRGGGQSPTPGDAYPNLPPLPGYEPRPPVDAEARVKIAELEEQLEDLIADLKDKEARLQKLFGGDYDLMKQIAKDAKAAGDAAATAQSTADEAAKVLKEELPTTIDDKITEAVDGIPKVDVAQEVEDRFGVIRDGLDKLRTRIDEAREDGAEGAREVATSVVWGVIKSYRWPVGGGLALVLFLLWRRIEAKREAGEPLLYERGISKLEDLLSRLDDDSLIGRIAGRVGERFGWDPEPEPEPRPAPKRKTRKKAA